MVAGIGEDEQSDDEVKDFLNLSGGDASDASFHGGTCAKNSLGLSEQMEFQILSEQLGISITDNEESPRLDVSFCISVLVSSFLLIRFVFIDNIHIVIHRIFMRCHNKQPL